MKLSPLDIKHQDFKQTINGYNKAQVRDFLVSVSEMLEQKVEDVRELRIQVVERDEKIKDLQVSELELKKAAILAERIGNEAKGQAERESELILREANAKSADIIKGVSDREREALNQVDELLKEAETERDALLLKARAEQEEIKSESKLIKESALQEAELLKKQTQREAEAQKRRTERIIENLKKQVEIDVQKTREETVHDIEEFREKETKQLKILQDDVVGLDQVRQIFIMQFQDLLKEFVGKLERFTGPISDVYLDEREKAVQGDSNSNKNNVGKSISPHLLAEIEKRLFEQIQGTKADLPLSTLEQSKGNPVRASAAKGRINDVFLDELSDDLDDVWIGESDAS